MRRAVALLVVVGVCAACGGKTSTSEEVVFDALEASELRSRVVDYEVERDDATVAVEVRMEDDYRYAAELRLDDDVVYREVVFDDALAAQLVDAAASTLLGQSPDAETALTAGTWIVDDLGAPATIVTNAADGADPIVDALAYFAYVRDAARAGEVRKFDDDALDYRPDEDPFEKPEPGVRRYDILPTSLPTRADLDEPIGADVPDLSDLRKLAVYVEDGQVIAIREAVDAGLFVDELRRVLAMSDASADALLDRVNELRSGVGQDPLVPRRTTVLIEASDEPLRVELPRGTAGRLSLHVVEPLVAG